MATLTSIHNARRMVVKIGSALLVDAKTGRLRMEWLEGLARDVVAAKNSGQDILIVSSGSIALGRRVLALPPGELSLEQAQAAAAVGQIRLARAYEEVLATHNITTAQILLTLDDSANRRRYLNSRATLGTILSLGAVPIVNENDTVATDEIRFGDNDRLAAQVALMAGADLLVLLSDVDGLYTANPKVKDRAKHIDIIEQISTEIEEMAGTSINSESKGGMTTKILAAKTATGAGCAMVIMQGEVTRPLQALGDGARHSWFNPQGDPQTARKSWISGLKTRGEITLDTGAVKALKSGKSLLAAGVTACTGAFKRGDAVAIVGPEGEVVGKGLAGYERAETAIIQGRHSREIAALLGYPGRAALIHRDDMVL